MQEKKILARAIGMKERKLRVTSEISFSFGNNSLHYHAVSRCIFRLFKIIIVSLIIISEKCVATPSFLFRFQKPSLRSAFPHSHKLRKKNLCTGMHCH